MMDTRPFERITSVLLLLAFAPLPLCMGAPLATLAMLERDVSPSVPIGIACCALAAVPFGVVPFLAMIRWSRSGRAPGFLGEVAAALGGGKVDCATLLFPTLSPRLTGTIDGRAYRLTLRRTAGLLSPSRVGAKFLIFGWMFELRVEAEIGSKVGYAPAGTIGGALFGLSNERDLPGMRIWGDPALAERPAALDAARRALAIGQPLLRAGPDAIDASGMLRTDIAPADIAAFVRDVGSLAKALAP